MMHRVLLLSPPSSPPHIGMNAIVFADLAVDSALSWMAHPLTFSATSCTCVCINDLGGGLAMSLTFIPAGMVAMPFPTCTFPDSCDLIQVKAFKHCH